MMLGLMTNIAKNTAKYFYLILMVWISVPGFSQENSIQEEPVVWLAPDIPAIPAGGYSQ